MPGCDAAWQRKRNLVQRRQKCSTDTINHRLSESLNGVAPLRVIATLHFPLSATEPDLAPVPDSNACGSPTSASRFVVTYVKTIVYIRCYSEVHVTDLSAIVRSGEHLPEYLLLFC